ncbi:MAG: M3 family metallopeptidase [Oscillospiraceae bacterium]
MEADDLLRQYRFYFRQAREDSRYLLGSQGEDIMARMQLSGSNAWGDLQAYLTSTVEVDYQDGVTNLSAIRNLAYDPDPAVRKAAYEAELASYRKIQDSVAFALNSIKLETIHVAQLRGYESPLDMALKDARMQRATLEAMFSAIDRYLPKFWAYLRAKAKALGHENGLPWYDLFAPMGKSGKTYTTEEARDYLLHLFGQFDPELRDMVAEAFANAWIDFYPRPGKTGGAFCAGVEKLNESRILTNFDGSFSDIVTLAHELGHAFHNHILNDQRPLNRYYTMPVAETASTFNECVVMNAAIAAATDREEKLALIESQLSDATQIICDIYSRYRFESAVFANRQNQFLPAEELCKMMLEAQKQSYGDGLDESCLHPYMWVCKSHYYGGVSFYNFPYAFGGLFARGLYAQYEKEGRSFLPKYKKLLHETPVRTVERGGPGGGYRPDRPDLLGAGPADSLRRDRPVPGLAGGSGMSGIEKLMAFLDGSPSCFHAVANLTRRLEEAGYTPLSEAEDWQLLPGGKYYLTRNQSALIAFRVPQSKPQGFMLSASHSDRPCFKIKENPELETAGVYLRLAVERYGGMLMAPWLDRPLSAAGRVLVETAEGIRSCLVTWIGI